MINLHTDNIGKVQSIRIRPATSSDLMEIKNIGTQTFIETFADTNTEEDLKKYIAGSFNEKQLMKELSNIHSQFFIAEIQQRSIGYLKLNTGKAQTEMKSANALEIQRIYVLKEYYGKSVGQLLFNKARKIAMENKNDFIWLGVWEKNSRAIQFYKKNGFVEFAQHVFKLGDDLQTDLLLKLQLVNT